MTAARCPDSVFTSCSERERERAGEREGERERERERERESVCVRERAVPRQRPHLLIKYPNART